MKVISALVRPNPMIACAKFLLPDQAKTDASLSGLTFNENTKSSGDLYDHGGDGAFNLDRGLAGTAQGRQNHRHGFGLVGRSGLDRQHDVRALYIDAVAVRRNPRTCAFQIRQKHTIEDNGQDEASVQRVPGQQADHHRPRLPAGGKPQRFLRLKQRAKAHAVHAPSASAEPFDVRATSAQRFDQRQRIPIILKAKHAALPDRQSCQCKSKEALEMIERRRGL
jgi:hypothetical protein